MHNCEREDSPRALPGVTNDSANATHRKKKLSGFALGEADCFHSAYLNTPTGSFPVKLISLLKWGARKRNPKSNAAPPYSPPPMADALGDEEKRGCECRKAHGYNSPGLGPTLTRHRLVVVYFTNVTCPM
jgi:hypothetical protein